MSGKNHRTVRQRKEVLLNGASQLFKASTGKIGTADGPLKKGVSCKYKAFLLHVEGNTARRMAGRVDDLKCIAAGFNFIAVLHPYICIVH